MLNKSLILLINPDYATKEIISFTEYWPVSRNLTIPVVEGGSSNAQLSANVIRLSSGFFLMNRSHDLCLGKPPFFHVVKGNASVNLQLIHFSGGLQIHPQLYPFCQLASIFMLLRPCSFPVSVGYEHKQPYENSPRE